MHLKTPIFNTIVLSSGIYNWLYTTGFHTSYHLYNLIVICELLAVISIPLALIHLIYNEELLHWLTLFKPSSNIQLLEYNAYDLDINLKTLSISISKIFCHCQRCMGYPHSVTWCFIHLTKH
jgi:hypothetical protein